MNIIDLATKSMQSAIKAVVDGIKTTTDATKTEIENISAQIENKDAGKVLKSKTFTANGTFTVPEGVTEVFITGGGAGGGGCIGVSASVLPVYHGKAGGATSFGNLLTLSGGGGAISVTSPSHQSPGLPGGPGGGYGEVNHVVNGSLIGASGGCSGPYFGGGGSNLSNPNQLLSQGGYCSGGGGLYYSSYTGTGGGGGDFVYDRLVTVAPLSTIQVTVGQGGIGGVIDTSIKAGNGGNGILTVKWWE